MKATINGNNLVCSTTKEENLVQRLLNYITTYDPQDRGKQVLIWVTDEEITEYFNQLNEGENLLIPKFSSNEDISLNRALAMRTLAQAVNAEWANLANKISILDHETGMRIANPNDIELEVVSKGQWNGTSYEHEEYLFQILTKPWFGMIPNDSGKGYVIQEVTIKV